MNIKTAYVLQSTLTKEDQDDKLTLPGFWCNRLTGGDDDGKLAHHTVVMFEEYLNMEQSKPTTFFY